MSVSETVISADDPRLNSRLIPAEPEFSNPIATAVYAAGHPRRASRIEHCGEYKSQKCEEGHVTRRHRFCGTRTCDGKNCAHKIADRLIERGLIDADHAIHRMNLGRWPKKFTFIDFAFDCAHDLDSISAQVTKVIDKFLDLVVISRDEIEMGVISPLALWTYAAGLNDAGQLIVRVIAFDDLLIAFDEFASLFGAVSADVHVVPLRLVHKFVRLLFAVTIPKDPTLRGVMEVAFIGIRRLRTVGQFDPGGEEELLVEEKDGKPSTNNSELSDTQEGIEIDQNDVNVSGKRLKLCPICHKHIIAESGWMPKNFPPPLPEKTTFYPSTS